MAKQGEGDARWIVADRSDGTNGAAARLFPPKKPPPSPAPSHPWTAPAGAMPWVGRFGCGKADGLPGPQ